MYIDSLRRLVRLLLLCLAWTLCLSSSVACAQAQSSRASEGKAEAAVSQEAESPRKLEKEFFALLRAGKAKQFLKYVSDGGVNVGKQAQHLSRAEVERQMQRHQGLYCTLFDSRCIESQIRLDQSNVRACSYKEMLSKSKQVRLASSEMTRNGVRQAVLVAEIKNDNCAGVGLIDFIFNQQADGWKLFSIP
jgi:hypothetical protein